LADKRSAIYHNMYTMLNAGLDLLKVFATVTKGLKGSYKSSWQKLGQSVAAGAGIADGMKEQGRAFEEFDILMISTGERSGDLPKVLELLSKWYEFRNKIVNSMRSKLIFPLLVLHMAVPAGALAVVLIDGGGVKAFLGEVLSTLAIFYIPAICVLLILYLSKKRPILRYGLDYAVLRIPTLGKAVFNLSLTRYCRSFNMLSSAGLGAIETAERATNLIGNIVVKRLLEGGVDATRAGNNTSEGFVAEQLPCEFMDLWRVGEESGSMDKVTAKLADITADRAEFWFETFANWFPKLIYACVCIMMAIKVFQGYSKIYGSSF